MKKAVKKGAKAAIQPFKKLKQTLSITSTSRSTRSTRSSATPALSEQDAASIGDQSSNHATNEHGSEGEAEVELTPEQELGKSPANFLLLNCIEFLSTEALKKTWRSPIYAFFKPDVIFEYHDGRPCHFFSCAAPKCKLRVGGVRRFQDSKDKSSTANLKYHALRCFGEDAVNDAIAGKQSTKRNGSIFAMFARKGKQFFNYSHRIHTNPEVQ